MNAVTCSGSWAKRLIAIVLAVGMLASPVSGAEGGEKSEAFVTQVYQVPPGFLSSGPDGIEFTSPMEMLTTVAGVTFLNGTSAILNGENHQLIVRNSLDQLELVEHYIESLRAIPQIQVHVKATFVTSAEPLFGGDGRAHQALIEQRENATFFDKDRNRLVDLLTQTRLADAVNVARSKDLSQYPPAILAVERSRVLSPEEFAKMIDEWYQYRKDGPNVVVVDGTGGYLQSGQGGLLIQADERGVVCDVVIGAGYETLDLGIYSQGPAIEGQGNRRLVNSSVSIPDGYTVVIERRRNLNEYEYDFVTAQLVDAAGSPIVEENDDPPVKKEVAAKKPAGEEQAGKAVPASVDLYTNVYQVPPTFLNLGGSGGPTDPFAPRDQKKATPRPEARQILAKAGISFGKGASAIYQPGTSQLIVRNTMDQMELVEAYIESISSSPEKQIFITTLFVETDEKLFEGPEIGVSNAVGESGKLKAARTKVSSDREMAELLGQEDVAQAVSNRQQAEAVKNAKVAKIFSHSDFETALKNWRKKKPWSEMKGESVVLRSGQGDTVLAAGKRGVGVVAVVAGADSFSVDIELMLQGRSFEDGKVRRMAKGRSTVWSGSTLAYARQLSNGHYQYDFITVEVINPSGQPSITEDEIAVVKKGEKPERFKKKPVTPSPRSETEITARDEENVRKADQLALQGNQLMSDQRYSQACLVFARALEVLPNYPFTEDRRLAYLSQHYAALRASEKEKAAEKGQTE